MTLNKTDQGGAFPIHQSLKELSSVSTVSSSSESESVPFEPFMTNFL